jgi:hypothetical protein
MIVNSVRRRKQTENEEVQQTDLCASVRLAFANHMDRLVAGNCAPSAPERTEMLAGADQAFDRPMILFQNIVEILHQSVLAILLNGVLVQILLSVCFCRANDFPDFRPPGPRSKFQEPWLLFRLVV